MTARASPSAATTAGLSPTASIDRATMPLGMPLGHYPRPMPTLFDDDYAGLLAPNVPALFAPPPKKPLLALSPTSSFDAFSQHFHLPLKIAAEQFGVRATAFKKRCRAIGIKHWPYRKVRSLKRSLQELHRCMEQGPLNDKQQYQYVTFKVRLGKLLAPETYGIDPSGRVLEPMFEDAGDAGEDESDDDTYPSTSTQSPRYGATLMDCNISPTETDCKTFGDYPAPAPAHLRSIRNAHVQNFYPSVSMAKASGELPSIPMCLGKESVAHGGYKLQFGYDHPMHDAGQGTQASRMYAEAASLHDVKPEPGEFNILKHDETRDVDASNASTSTAAAAAAATNDAPSSGHADYSSDRFFDDVFLQISPDFGCLV